MLSVINYSPKHHKWLEFIRRVGYKFSKVTKLHESKLIPSLQQLILHSKRANYILKFLLSVPLREFHSSFVLSSLAGKMVDKLKLYGIRLILLMNLTQNQMRNLNSQ